MTEATQTTTTDTNAVTPAPAPKTRREKLVDRFNKLDARIKADVLERDEIFAEVNAIDTLAAVGAGSTVIISVGKGETAKEVTGIVVGVRQEEDGGKTYKVQYGSGFDADIAVVKAGKIKLPPQPVGEAVEQAAA